MKHLLLATISLLAIPLQAEIVMDANREQPTICVPDSSQVGILPLLMKDSLERYSILLSKLENYINESKIENKQDVLHQISLLKNALTLDTSHNEVFSDNQIDEISTVIAYTIEHFEKNISKPGKRFILDSSLFEKCTAALPTKEELIARLEMLKEKMQNLITKIDELSRPQIAKATSSIQAFAHDHTLLFGTIVAALGTGVAAYLFPQQTKKVASRLFPYGLLGLYLLRTQKKSDIEALNSTLLNDLKYVVGDSKKDSYQGALQVTSAEKIQAQLNVVEKWNKDHPDKTIKVTTDGSADPFNTKIFKKLGVKFIDSELVKIGIGALAITRIAKDWNDLVTYLGFADLKITPDKGILTIGG